PGSWSAAMNSSRVWTRVSVQFTSPASSCSRTSSASLESSSSSNIRRGPVMLPSSHCLLHAPRRWLVHDGTEYAHPRDRVPELVEVDRLHDIGVHAELVAPHHVLLFMGGGQHHHGNHPQPLVGLDPLQHLQPIDLRQLEIEQHDRGILVR